MLTQDLQELSANDVQEVQKVHDSILKATLAHLCSQKKIEDERRSEFKATYEENCYNLRSSIELMDEDEVESYEKDLGVEFSQLAKMDAHIRRLREQINLCFDLYNGRIGSRE